MFAHKAYYLGRRFENIDMAYVTSTPLTVALTALRLKRKKQISFVFEIRDLWPEAPIRLNELRNIFIKAASRRLEQKAYKEASKIIALSPGIFEYVSKLFPNKPIRLCPNFSDCNFFEKTEIKNKSLLEKHGIGEAFVISYFGAIGKINALEYFLDLVKISEDHGMDIRFFIIGEGAMLNHLQKLVKDRNLKTIEFLPHMDKYRLKEYLSICDAAYISFTNNPVMKLNSPNKFFDALASGKIVITNTRGWIRDLVEKNECGFYLDPENPEDFVPMVNPFLSEPHLHKQQDNSRKLAEGSFDKDKRIQELLDFIEN